MPPRELGLLWMQRNDLRGYVLLGDPAARLAIVAGRAPAAVERPDLDAPPRPPAAIEVRSDAPAPSAASPPAAAPSAAAAALPAEALSAASSPVAAPSAAAAVPPAAAERDEGPPLAPHDAERAAAPSGARGPAPSEPPHAAYGAVHSPTQAGVPYPPAPPPPPGAAPLASVGRPRTLENPEIALRERAVLAMIRGDEAPRSIAARFGLPLEEIFYWLDVYREAGRRALAG